MILSELSSFGLDPKILDYGLTGTALLIIYYLGKIILFMVTSRHSETEEIVKQDEKQTYLQQTLVDLASTSMDESRRTREAYEKNNEVLAQNTKALVQNAETMSAIVKSTAFLLEAVKTNYVTLVEHTDEVKKIESVFVKKLDDLSSQVDKIYKRDVPAKLILKDEDDKVMVILTAVEELLDGSDSALVVKILEQQKEDIKEKVDVTG